LYNILRDANRTWYLSPRVDARHCPGTPLNDIPRAKRILGRLILEAGNLSAVKSALASGSGASFSLPGGSRAILDAMSRRLENGEWTLVEGPVRVRKASAPGKPEADMVPVERADWRSADDVPAETKEPVVTIGVEHEIEPVSVLECGFEIEPDGGLETGYEIDASEPSPAEAAESGA
jgi:hypothetical protein